MPIDAVQVREPRVTKNLSDDESSVARRVGPRLEEWNAFVTS